MVLQDTGSGYGDVVGRGYGEGGGIASGDDQGHANEGQDGYSSEEADYRQLRERMRAARSMESAATA